MRLIAAFCLLLALPAAAQAAWFEASSANFVVYADDSERDIRKFAEQLERYHEAMEVITNRELPEPSPSNRVTVYVVGNVSKVQKLYGEGGRGVGGFYIPRAGGATAFVPDIRVSSGGPLPYSMKTLLHEYAHHFLLSNSSLPSPRWLGEGGAEFFSGARFTGEGGLTLGLFAESSAFQFVYQDSVTAEQLLDPEAYVEPRRRGDSFYAKSWLLYHYLVFEEARRGQLRQYIAQLGNGKSAREAAIEVFGDLDTLEDELVDYMKRPRMLSYVFQPEQLEPAPVTIRRLSDGEAEMMPVRIVSRRGVTREQALELLPEAREIAAEYAQDAAVLAALAEAEFDAGNDAEAIAAADAAIALDPSQTNAYLQKGYALFRRAAETEGDERVAAYRAAAAPFQALNRIEPDHPLPLYYYYLSVVAREEQASELAVLGLARALELAPFDFALRMTLFGQQVRDRDYEGARLSLRPVAYNPHGGQFAEAAVKVMEFLSTAQDPDPDEVLAMLAPPGDGTTADAVGEGGAEGDNAAGADGEESEGS